MHVTLPAWIAWVFPLAALAAVWLAWRLTRTPDHEQFAHMVRMLRLRSDAVCLIDTRRHITWTNEAYGALTGYAPEELAGRSLCDLLNESLDDPGAIAKIDTALRAPQELRIDTRFRRKTGEVRYMVIELHPVRDVRGRRLLGHAVVQIDIDRHRRERETTLQALRDRQAVLDILDRHAIVTETDLQGTIIRVNARFAEVSGYAPEELLGRNHRMVSSGHHDAAFWRGMWETISAGGIWHGEVCNRAKDGSLYWVDSVMAPMLGSDGLPERYLSIRTDITTLKHSLDMLAHTSRIAGIGGWTYDLSSEGLRFTDEALTILGLSDRHMQAEDVAQRMLPTPQARTEFRERVKRTLDAGENFAQDIEMRAPDGRPLWVRVSCEAVAPQGQRYRIIGAVQDVTAQVEARLRTEASERILRSSIDALDEAFALYDAQERLVFCNDKYLDLLGERRGGARPGVPFEAMLRLAVAAGTYRAAAPDPEAWIAAQLRLWRQPSYRQRQQLGDGRWIKSVGNTTQDGMHVMFRVDITDLQTALEAADAASHSKSQFLANMSHEIRTPMNAVLGLLQLLEHTGLDAEQSALLHQMERSARALLDILNDILDFSKIEAGKMRLDPEPFVLDELLDDLSTILCGNLGRKSLELIYDIDPAIPPVLVGDAPRLKQVLINLGGNAIKFTAQGEVLVRMRLARQDARGVLLECAVEDTGIGIAPEAIARIFNGFSQAEASTSRRFGGTGLGLAISQRLVQLMGGELRVESQPGQGSRFFFQIVLRADVEMPEPWPPRALAGATALLLEPHPTSRRALSHMLQQRGEWCIHAFADVPAALQALEDGLAPALALLSTAAPDHLALAERLRAHASAQELPEPAILLSASHQQPLPTTLPVLRKPLTCSMVQLALYRQAPQPTPADKPAAQPAQRLAGLRRLLAEDNEINQEVALRLLRREGAEVRVAANGQQCLEALDADPRGYDLVLMDVQMPVLDGLQATQAIRRQPRHAALPILAMTANAMPSDRAACLAAGMNGHVGKPFDLRELVGAILQHTGQDGTAGAPATPAPADSVLDAATALAQLGQDVPFYSRLLRGFAPAARTLAQQACAALRAGDGPRARDAAHQLKSTAAATGALQLAALCAQAEGEADTAAHPASAPQREILAARLEEALEQALTAQAEWLRTNTPAPATVGAGPTVAEALDALAAALETSDMASFELFDALLEHHAAAWDEAALQPLRKAMDHLDTEAALRAVQALQARHAG